MQKYQPFCLVTAVGFILPVIRQFILTSRLPAFENYGKPNYDVELCSIRRFN